VWLRFEGVRALQGIDLLGTVTNLGVVGSILPGAPLKQAPA
jgi:hypothetical protein